MSNRSSGSQQNGPRTASTSELQSASHQLSQMVQSHLGTSTPSPAPASAPASTTKR